MKENRRSGVFYKFLLSYIILLLIPILILGALIYNSFLKILTDEVLNKNTDMLIQVKNTIDTQMSELWKISVNLVNNPDLPRENAEKNPVESMKIVRYAANYCFSNSFAEEMLLYMHGGSIIYSSSGTYTVDNFINTVYHFSRWKFKDFINEINTVTYPVIRPSEDVTLLFSGNERYITYLLPVSPSRIHQYATLIFLINEKTVNNILKNIVKSHGGNVIILDDQSNIITCIKNEKYLDTAVFKKYATISEGLYSSKISLNNTEYYFSSVKSEVSNWKYVTVIPVHEVVEKPSQLRVEAFWGILSILLIGSMIIYFVMHLNYIPIRRLKNFTEEKWGRKLPAANEIESVRQALEHAFTTAEALHVKVENSRSALKDGLLQDLLNGRLKNLDELNKKGSDIDIAFSKSNFFAAIFYLHSSVEVEKAEIIKEIEDYFLPEIDGYGKSDTNENSIVFVFSSDEIGYGVIEEKLIQLQEYLNKRWNLEVTIGVGNQFKYLSEIGKSYIEATTAIDYRLIKGKNKVILFNEILQYHQNIYYYSNEKLEQLELFLLQGNEEKIDETLKNILLFIKKNNISLFMVRSICFDIVNTVLKAIHRINREFSGDMDYPDVMTLTGFETVEELAGIVQRISTDICSYIREHRNNRKSQLEEFMRYISRNYDDYGFSIQNMADHFQVSISNLSHYFKDQSGENISDYVNDLRMRKAKNLLTDTDKSLQEIVPEIGYANVSSFIRKFKQVTGTTPGDYRKLSRMD